MLAAHREAFRRQNLRVGEVQGYLSHKKTPTSWEHRGTLCTGLL